MSSFEKALKKLLNNPESLKYSQIENILLNLHFVKIQAKGSHIKFKHKSLDMDIIIPIHKNDCKEFYKRLVSKIIRNNNLHQ